VAVSIIAAVLPGESGIVLTLEDIIAVALFLYGLKNPGILKQSFDAA
jgi:hypothetical protein